ncbi:hypothetical protein G9C98_005879 [Cotesia typhae]|uniref:RNA polymerase II-associated factor 1 homolog n=1 Tax=Cotesia typhae TaxID=2053667 RepID=A0A8J5V9R0_9HYME|nr:hypothetical protein G9C98_005879 [Cotesia typhae]
MLPTETASPMDTIISPFPETTKIPLVYDCKRSDILCRIQYSNKLPDIPFDLKFLIIPFKSTRFSNYTPSTLERNHKHEFLTDYDMGIDVDLVDIEKYASTETETSLHPDDEKLLEDDCFTLPVSKRSKMYSTKVVWLRSTEYISPGNTRLQPQVFEKIEAQVGGKSIKKLIAEGIHYLDHDQQLKAIDKTFADNKIPIERHHNKPNVYPVEVLPVFPDFELWKHPCAQVIFDIDPSPAGYSQPQQLELMSQAMLRGVMDENEEQFVAYFLPSDETVEKRKKDIEAGVDYRDDENYLYKMFREYNWNVKSKSTEGYEENYFMVLRDNGLYYNELETKVRLSKRTKAGGLMNRTMLIVKHRPLNDHELNVQRSRTNHFKSWVTDNNGGDEGIDVSEHGEDDEEEEEEAGQSGEEKNFGSRNLRSRSRSLSSNRSTGVNSQDESHTSIKSEQNSHSIEVISDHNADCTDQDTESD